MTDKESVLVFVLVFCVGLFVLSWAIRKMVDFYARARSGVQAMKLCKTCKHREELYEAFEACARNVRVRIDMQDGSEIIAGWRSTREEREQGRIMARINRSCGKEGRFWEAKP